MPNSHKITPQEALQRTIEHREIFHDEMLHIMRLIMSGEMSPVMMAALITGLRVKKETIGEITAAAQVMREFSTKVHVADKTHLVDIVGTGGDGSHTFNISTCAMFVAAAAGAKVSKHGGRSVSSKCGSADVMESLGININLSPEAIARASREVGRRLHVRAQPPSGDEKRGAGAQGTGHQDHLQHPRAADQPGRRTQHPDGRVSPRPGRHPGARPAAPGRRTRRWWCMARTAWTRSAWARPRVVGELKNGEITEYEIHPEDFGMAMASNRALRVETPEQSKAMLLGVLDNQPGAPRDIVILNAGAALYAANVADSMKERRGSWRELPLNQARPGPSWRSWWPSASRLAECPVARYRHLDCAGRVGPVYRGGYRHAPRF